MLAVFKMIEHLDEVNDFYLANAGFEAEPGSFERAREAYFADMRAATNEREIAEAQRKGLDALRALPQHRPARPLRVGIVGEYFTAADPASNLDLERKLSNPIVYVVLFTILSPLALYRGPLNMYGLGSGLANIFLTAGKLSAPAVGMALRSTSVVQCVADPTNTQNVIVADYAKVDVNDILKSTLPYTMVMALGILVYTATFLF